jgi:hypothetical protein
VPNVQGVFAKPREESLAMSRKLFNNFRLVYIFGDVAPDACAGVRVAIV